MYVRLLYMKVMTIQLPEDVHADIKKLANEEAVKLGIGRLSKVDYLRRLIAREKAQA